MPVNDDRKARDRLLVYTAARLTGLVILLMGVAVMYTDWLRPGGWPQVGALIAILGAIDSLAVPLLLRRIWQKQDAGPQ